MGVATSRESTDTPPPSAYVEGYARAGRLDPAAADNYIRHTAVGDPVLDPVIRELASLPPSDFHKFIRAGIEGDDEALRAAPRVLRDFFDEFRPPPWLDHDSFDSGVRVFHANSELMLVTFVTAVLIEGLSTLISKSFNMTGRVAATDRRLRQNNRQLLEIFFPGGLRREGDGWKLSMRVRFVHARMRDLLARSEDWDHEAWGMPISAAHLGYAISVFSHRLLEGAVRIGAKFSREERDSILAVWRYAGYLMGIPETILYANAAEADRIYRIGKICEPPPDADAIAVTNALIGSIPGVAGITDPEERKNILQLAYRLSRAFLGKELADQLQFPHATTFGTLLGFRVQQRIRRWRRTLSLVRADNFSQLLQMSVYEDRGVSYRMPDDIRHSQSSWW